jgi:transposase-like protein
MLHSAGMKTIDAETVNLVTLAKEYSDERKARALFESMRWPDGPVCPHCKNHKEKPIQKLASKKETTKSNRIRSGVYFCSACRKNFTATVGTVLEDSHIPISKWMMAIFILCSSKKSISAHQLHRMLGITYKTAWFMAHRIRYAMGATGDTPKLDGTVEADETFIGGVGDGRTKLIRHTPVVALVQRDGPMRTAVVSNVTQKNLGKVLNECVSKTAVVNTDEHSAYRTPLKEYKRHDKVVHSKFQYARHNADGSVSHVNSCESFFSLLKRGVVGSWHHVSREHLPKYASEFEFRWNQRKVSDGERMVAAVATLDGKRLTYKQAI